VKYSQLQLDAAVTVVALPHLANWRGLRSSDCRSQFQPSAPAQEGPMTSVRRSLVGGLRFATFLLVPSLSNMFARPQKAGQRKRAPGKSAP